MEEAASYFFFAERFGWPPEVVDNLPVRLYDRLPAVAVIHDQVAEAKQKEQIDAAKE